MLFYSSSWRGIFLYVLARNVRTLPWQVLSYVFIFPSFLKPWADSPAEIGHPLLPACSRRAGRLSAGLWLRRGVDRLCFRPRCPQLSLSLGTWADITTQGPRCQLPPGPLFRTQAMPPNSRLAVMVGSAPRWTQGRAVRYGRRFAPCHKWQPWLQRSRDRFFPIGSLSGKEFPLEQPGVLGSSQP